MVIAVLAGLYSYVNIMKASLPYVYICLAVLPDSKNLVLSRNNVPYKPVYKTPPPPPPPKLVKKY